MDISVIIPTRDRPAKLKECLRCLTRQAEGCPSFEVIVVLDGPDAMTEDVVGQMAVGLRVQSAEAQRLGIAEAKNIGIRASRGRLLVFLNDDVLPDRGFLRAHFDAHAAREFRPAMVVGHSPWVVHQPDRLFDRLFRCHSMIFFYDQMVDEHGIPKGDAGQDWGFRHAWNLNLSVPRETALDIGGFRPAIANCCHEDVEFAFRIARGFGAGVFFEPSAIAPHDHRYEPASYFEREFRLGYSALGLAEAAPECGVTVFGRDLSHVQEADFASKFIEREGARARRLREQFERVSMLPANAFAGACEREAVELLYGLHLLPKRVAFLEGLLAAHEGKRFAGLFHPADGLNVRPGLEGLPRVRGGILPRISEVFGGAGDHRTGVSGS